MNMKWSITPAHMHGLHESQLWHIDAKSASPSLEDFEPLGNGVGVVPSHRA
jgi:hypothetical protein